MDMPYAIETRDRKTGKWVIRRFAKLPAARRFQIAESRRLRIGLQLARLTPVEGGIVTEFAGFNPGTWVRA